MSQREEQLIHIHTWCNSNRLPPSPSLYARIAYNQSIHPPICNVREPNHVLRSLITAGVGTSDQNAPTTILVHTRASIPTFAEYVYLHGSIFTVFCRLREDEDVAPFFCRAGLEVVGRLCLCLCLWHRGRDVYIFDFD